MSECPGWLKQSARCYVRRVELEGRTSLFCMIVRSDDGSWRGSVSIEGSASSPGGQASVMTSNVLWTVTKRKALLDAYYAVEEALPALEAGARLTGEAAS